MKILIIGSQGSGKSTQAELLAKELGFCFFSTGNLFRKAACEKTPFGRKIKNLMESGRLIDDEQTLKLVHNILKNKEDYVIEGFPRNLFQAKKFKYSFDKAFFLKISEKEAIKRLTARRVCQKCRANFNLLTKPPKQKNICDKCGAKLTQRPDDTEKAIKQRLNIFYKQTNKVLDYYHKKNILEEIDANRPIKVILQDILSRISRSRIGIG